MDNFNEKLVSFLAGAVEMRKKGKVSDPDLFLMEGKKFIRIVSQCGSQRMCWGFIDKTNGDVLKAAGWKAPAKHARGNIFDESNGLKTIGVYGPAYLR